MALCQHLGQAKGATGGAGRQHAPGQIGHEGDQVVAPARPRPGMGGQVNHRAEAAGARHRVAVERLAGAGDAKGVDIDGRDPRRGDPLLALGLDHGRARQDADTARPGDLDQFTVGCRPGVGHRHHLAAGVQPIERGTVAVVVAGGHHQPLARHHAVTADVGGHRRAQQIARHVVAGVDQRTLVGTSGQHHARGPHPMQARARLTPSLHSRCAVAQVLAAPLVQGDKVVVVIAVGGSAHQQRHLGVSGKLLEHLLDPLRRRTIIQQRLPIQQRAAKALLLVAQDHPGAAARGGQGRRQPRRPCPDHQHLAVAIDVVVDVRVALQWTAPQPRALADIALVGHPQRGRRHEGLIVEAGGHQLAAKLADGSHQVALDVGPAVGGTCRQPLEQGLLGGAHIGYLLGFGVAELDHRIGLLGAGGDDAAGTRILEAAIDHVHPVGQQRRGQSVPVKAGVFLAVEGKAQGPAAVDQAPGVEAIGLTHARTSWAAVAISLSSRDSAVTASIPSGLSRVKRGCSPMR